MAPAPAAEPVNQIIDDAIPVEPVAKVIASERVEEPLKPVTEPEQVTAQSVAAQVIPLPDLWQPPEAEALPDPVLAAITAFYAIPCENLTCERVAEVLQRFSLGEWDQDDRQTLADACVGRLIASNVWVALLKCILYRMPVASDRGSIVRRIDFPTLKQGHNSIAKDLAVAFRQSDTTANFHFAFHDAASLG